MNKVIENWDKIMQKMQKEYEISPIQYKTFLKPLSVYKVEGNHVTISMPPTFNHMGSNFISSRYTLPLQVCICEVVGMPECELTFITQDENTEEIPETIEPVVPDFENDPRYAEANLNPKYTFDTFIVGNNNKFAQAAALAVAEFPGEAYNPFFIYGGPGLGKTHLMHSIAHYILQHNKESKVLYVTSEEFTNDLIKTLRHHVNNDLNDMSEFRQKYRNIDVLLVDDIQFIIGKDSTQEEFFNTFNSLHNAKKQIIISSDKPPKDMKILDERFRSRFEWGLIADITLPDYETRMAILHKKEDMDGYHVTEDVIQYIANNIKSNIRELEGAFNRVVAFAKLEKKEVSLELAEKALKDIISPAEKKATTPEDVITAVCDYYQVSSTDLAGNKRNAKIVMPRQVAMYLCREITAIPYKNIGKILGNRDHTTVLHGIDKVENEMKSNESLKSDIDILKKRLSSQ